MMTSPRGEGGVSRGLPFDWPDVPKVRQSRKCVLRRMSLIRNFCLGKTGTVVPVNKLYGRPGRLGGELSWLSQAGLTGQHDCLVAVVDADLVEHVGDVVAHGLF